MGIEWTRIINSTVNAHLKAQVKSWENQRLLFWHFTYSDWKSKHPRYAERSQMLRERLRAEGNCKPFAGATPHIRSPHEVKDAKWWRRTKGVVKPSRVKQEDYEECEC